MVLVKSGKLSPHMLVLHRPMEYDTLMDPPDPLTASAQVLFGVIMSFITGLVDTPGEIYRGLSSAARGIRQPHEHFDRHSACRAALSSPGHSSPENSLESDESPIQNAVGQMLTENNEQGDREIREENSTQEDTTDEENDDQVNELDRIRSTERKRNLQLEKAKTMSSSMTPSKPPKFTILHETALHGGQMSKKILKIIIWLPTDVSLGMARGFHNAPKLYSDPTVNDIPQVVSLRTGFRAAGKELKDGFYFGITGLITHPRYGLKHEGAKGLFKGIGKAMGGVFLKPTAGLWGLAGYPLSGITREINDSLGKHQKCMIVMGRISQGVEEMRESSAQEREEI
ncbi:hypothetical protein PENANT_c016G04379 [Penicillium antarcticum]|uniref:Uncharacterized protein n=1 Tax=Penicillium antarcticum TaxID=416450 RepID=A0A1V6Q2R5_9EURO|nr:hypothetical protein PENANT_c016G04379 [Penicillium antarcticum]